MSANFKKMYEEYPKVWYEEVHKVWSESAKESGPSYNDLLDVGVPPEIAKELTKPKPKKVRYQFADVYGTPMGKSVEVDADTISITFPVGSVTGQIYYLVNLDTGKKHVINQGNAIYAGPSDEVSVQNPVFLTKWINGG